MAASETKSKIRNLILVFGDQLNIDSPAIRTMNRRSDAVWMAEVDYEATYVWSHKLRLAFFFSAMRHFAASLESKNIPLHYTKLTNSPSKDRAKSLMKTLELDVKKLKPQKLIAVKPGDYRVLDQLKRTAVKLQLPLEILDDSHFLVSTEEFATWAQGKKQLTQEHFYREVRKRYNYLMEKTGRPIGGQWNFDADNRESFPSQGPQNLKQPHPFKPDDITKDVIKLVNQRFAKHPGRLASEGSQANFSLAVTRKDALAALRDFINNRLKTFGQYEDAMWENESFLYHSRLSYLLNVKLLNPREVIDAAIHAYKQRKLPIESVEGFVRQVAGWREFIRGIYWQFMPEYAEMNNLGCDDTDVPKSFWDGQTNMLCVRESMSHVLSHGYAHHIHRLMVLGLLAQLLNVHPMHFHNWHMAMYLDSIDWASLPNTLGMSQFADGGIVGTKPYCASGNYISRMSNFCKSCPYDPKESLAENACPMTTLYWDFLARHKKEFSKNLRMKFQMANLAKKDPKQLAAIRSKAKKTRDSIITGKEASL